MRAPELCRFDSPGWLSHLLVNSIKGPSPTRIVDLGSGAGILAAAALSKWSNAKLFTIDIDSKAGDETRLTLGKLQHAQKHCHFVANALSSMPEMAGLFQDKVDLVVSNPPYRSTEMSTEIAGMLKSAGMDATYVTQATVPMDLVFLAQAMRMVRPGGRIAFIVPDSLITGQRLAPFRADLLRQHEVERVVQLPRRSFARTDAQAYVMVLKHSRPANVVTLERISHEGGWRPPLQISSAAAAQRLDHMYHSSIENLDGQSGVSLAEYGAVITRGQLSSIQLTGAGTPTFHTSNFPSGGGCEVTLETVAGRQPTGRSVWAEAGDILVARVHRRLEEKVVFVKSGAAQLSDCVFRVRCPDHVASRVFEGLSSPLGTAQIRALARGTGARHISARSLLNLVI